MLSQGSCVYEYPMLWCCLAFIVACALCLFHGFLSMKALLHSLCFLSLLVHNLWSICLGWVTFSSSNYTFYNLYPICSWLGLTGFWDLLCVCVCVAFYLFIFFFGDSSQCGEKGSIMRQRQKSKRRRRRQRRRAHSEDLGWTQTQDVMFTPPQASRCPLS